MNKYKCQFPNCEFSTNRKTYINKHYIDQTNSERESNILYLCDEHLKFVYIENCKNENHSNVFKDSIIILGRYKNKSGDVLHYKTVNNKQYSYYMNINKITKW